MCPLLLHRIAKQPAGIMEIQEFQHGNIKCQSGQDHGDQLPNRESVSPIIDQDTEAPRSLIDQGTEVPRSLIIGAAVTLFYRLKREHGKRALNHGSLIIGADVAVFYRLEREHGKRNLKHEFHLRLKQGQLQRQLPQ